MKYKQLELEGVWLMEPDIFGDSRGYFFESFKAEEFRNHVGDISFVQENESFSSYGVFRGMHFQGGDSAQAKLIRVTEGEVLDIIVDMRHGSPTLGKHLKLILSGENHRQLFVPRGFAHGFLTLSAGARFLYKVDNRYDPANEHTLAYDDPTVAIELPLPANELTISPKDLRGLSFEEALKHI